MMSQSLAADQLSTLLGTTIVPAILDLRGAAEPAEVERFYGSQLYGALSVPETALWHLSPATLASMYDQELAQGRFDVPEEQS